MDISAVQLSVQSPISPTNVGHISAPTLTTASSVKSSAQPILDNAPKPVISSQDPTYNRPIQTKEASSKTENQQPTKELADTISEQSSEAEQDRSTKVSTANEMADDKPSNDEIYTEAELKLISDLKMRDAEVNAHERAHAAVGGQHTGTPSYSYKTGPDGVKYAVSGEVSIDISRVPGDPQATLQKAQQIKAAALAPAEPSGQDRKVAAKAEQMASQARSDILASNREGSKKSSDAAYAEATVPEHFTGQANLQVDGEQDEQHNSMSLRSAHIQALYHNSATVSSPSKFDIQV